MSSLTAPPLWNVAWGLFFHPTSATLSFLMTTSVPFAGSGTTASFLKLAFACLSVCAVLNHVYHLLVPLGISLEVQDTLFISGVALGVLPSLICVSRCFFLELPRKQAVLLTVLNVFIVTVWPVPPRSSPARPVSKNAHVRLAGRTADQRARHPRVHRGAGLEGADAAPGHRARDHLGDHRLLPGDEARHQGKEGLSKQRSVVFHH